MSNHDRIIRPTQGSDLEPLLSLKIITEKWTAEDSKLRAESEADDLTTVAYAAASVSHALTKVTNLIEALIQSDVASVSAALTEPMGKLCPPRMRKRKDLIHEARSAILALTRGNRAQTTEILTVLQVFIDAPNMAGDFLSIAGVIPSRIPSETGNRAQRRAKGRRR